MLLVLGFAMFNVISFSTVHSLVFVIVSDGILKEKLLEQIILVFTY